MPKNLHKKVNINDFWSGIYPIDLLNYHPKRKNQYVRFSIDNCNYALGDVLAYERMDSVLRSIPTIVTDHESIEHLLSLRGKPQSNYRCYGNTGWIYIFSNIAELYLGKEIDRFLLRETIRYECRLKIGRTFRHPIQRIHEQGVGSGHSRAIIPLGLFWSPNIIRDDKQIESRLSHTKLNDTPGIE